MCRIIAKTKNMEHEAWLELRRQGIGGSDAGAVCGLNPYASPMDVYADKIGVSNIRNDNEAMREGRDFEGYVAKRFTEATGLKVRRANVMYGSIKYPFMLADVDRLIVGSKNRSDGENGIVGLECKTASPYSAAQWEDGKIPLHYLAQCYHYMAVLNAKAWYIAVLIFGTEFKYVKIERDEEAIQNLIQLERHFWENNVLARVMPEPDGSEATDSFISNYFVKAFSGRMVKLTDFDERLKRREEITTKMKELDLEKRKIEQEVKVFMQDAEVAENESFFVSWKNTATNRIDGTRLKKEMPEVYKKYLKTTEGRRFVVKSVA